MAERQPFLLELSPDLLQVVVGNLDLKDRIKLFASCKKLAEYGAMDPWTLGPLRELEALQLTVDSPHASSLFLWLRRHSSRIKRLRIDAEALAEPKVFTAAILLGALFGGALERLEYVSYGHCDIDTWVLALPQLQFLSVCSQNLALHPALASLTSLTALQLGHQGLPMENSSLYLSQGPPCLVPTSLRSLVLHGITRLPYQLASPHLRSLWMDAGWNETVLFALQPLTQLSALTSLALRACWLERVPPEVAVLTALRQLDLTSNRLGRYAEGDNGAEAPLAALAPLSSLEGLFLESACGTGPEVVVNLSWWPRLQVLSLSRNGALDLAPVPASELPPGLRVLSVDFELAQDRLPLLSAMLPALRELALTPASPTDIPPARLQSLRQQVPKVQACLRAAPALERLVVWEGLALKLQGCSSSDSSAAPAAALVADWARELPGVQVLLGNCKAGHVCMQGHPRWDDTQ